MSKLDPSSVLKPLSELSPLDSTENLLTALDQADRKKPRTLTWDEAGIASDDALRGTRMKIDEPKTPFSRSFVFDEERDIPELVLSDALSGLFRKASNGSMSSAGRGDEARFTTDDGEEEEEEGEEEREKKRLFHLAHSDDREQDLMDTS